MLTTTSALTLSLATAFGVYALAGGISLLAAPARWRGVLDELAGSPALVSITGVLAFALGATLTIIHDLWTDPLAVTVSLLGWISALEGLVLIAWPAPFLRLITALTRPGPITVYAIAALLLGAILLFAGMTGRPELIGSAG